MVTMRKTILIGVMLGSLLQLSPIRVQSYRFTGETWQTTSFNVEAQILLPVTQADLDGDGSAENIAVINKQAILESNGQTVWTSPADWQVEQTLISDLNRDGLAEITLLLRRLFRPWPVDRWLPYGGRIADFQDSSGMSCHIILIGWKDGRYKEIWAGSSMSQPALKIAAADFNQDGRSELMTLEGFYDGGSILPDKTIKVWEWNGFGFSLYSSLPGRFTDFMIFKSQSKQNEMSIIAY